MFASRFREGRFRKCVTTVTISVRIGQAHYHMASALVSAVKPPPCWLEWLERMLWPLDTADSQAATWVVDLARR
jgi:hypothetical protein